MTEEKLNKAIELKQEIKNTEMTLEHFIEFKKAYFKNNTNRIIIKENTIYFDYYNDTFIFDKKLVKELNEKFEKIINDKLIMLNEKIKELNEKFERI